MAGKRPKRKSATAKQVAAMKAGYVVSFDLKRGVGFIRSADNNTYHAGQLSKHYKERAEQEQLVMFHTDAVKSEVPLLEGLKVRFEISDAASADDGLWRVASTVVPDEALSTAQGSASPADIPATSAEASPLTPTEVIEEAVAKAAGPSLEQANIRDVGFADEYGEGWDASSWDDS